MPKWLNGYGSVKFVLQSVLGVGGMGVVYRARHALMNCDVALKVVRPEYAHSPEVVERFFREARALSALNCPGIVRVLDCDVTADGCPFIALELLEGQDLRTVLEQQGRLSANKALGVMYEAAKAMGHAHAAGIIHRDLKPENVFLDTRAGRRPAQVKVIDFGVVRNLVDTRSITLVGNALGSIYYMAPEQIEDSHAIDARADVWSLGVILYECLTGELPFQASSQLAVSSVILHAQPEDVRVRCPHLPEPIAALVHRCLQKEPSARFANAQELADALYRCGSWVSGSRSHASASTSARSTLPSPAIAPSVRQHAVESLAPSAMRSACPSPMRRSQQPSSPRTMPAGRRPIPATELVKTCPSVFVLLCVFMLSLTVGAVLAKGSTGAWGERTQLLTAMGQSFITLGPR